MNIYQHVDELNDQDGIGNDILGFHSIFEELGLNPSVITRLNHSKKSIKVYSPTSSPMFFQNDLHILHYGGSGYPCDFFQSIWGRKVLRFHNTTPVYFFQTSLSEDLFKTFEKNEIKSFLELHSLHTSLDYVLHDSIFNQKEYLNIVDNKKKIPMKVVPVVRTYPIVNSLKEKSHRIGFVGRWVPNKKIEDLIFTLHFLKKLNNQYSLVIFGKRNAIFEMYNHRIFDIIKELELTGSVQFIEGLNDLELKNEISKLDIYLSMSEHEGFGIPILEAMAADVPVVAFSSSAVVETVQDAGMLFNKKDFLRIAELIHKVQESSKLKESILKSQRKKLDTYNQFPFKEISLELSKL